MFLQLLSYVGMVLGFCALVFLIATALYYVSEELEAHTVLAKRYITRYIYAVLAFHVLLWALDGLPLIRTAWSLLVNYQYLNVMSSFPVVNFQSVNFILACIGAVANHFSWFWYFNDNDLPPYSIHDRIPHFEGETLPPFSQIASFFGMLVWTVPFLLFLSLSANDNTLPTTNDGHAKPQRKGLARLTVERAFQSIMGFVKQYLPESYTERSRMTMPI